MASTVPSHMVEEVTYQCAMPGCDDDHTAHVVEWLPNHPLERAAVEALPENIDRIEAAAAGDFRSYTGSDQTYQRLHTDIMWIAADNVGFKLRHIPEVGWSREERFELGRDDPADAVEQRRNEYVEPSERPGVA